MVSIQVDLTIFNINLITSCLLTVTSTLIISPSLSSLSSGIPCAITLLIDVQTLLGNPL